MPPPPLSDAFSSDMPIKLPVLDDVSAATAATTAMMRRGVAFLHY